MVVRRRATRGFALVEVLCAASVFAVLLTVAYAGHAEHSRSAALALDATGAEHLVHSLLVRAAAAADAGVLPFGETRPDASDWHLPAGAVATQRVDRGPAGLWTVAVEVRWPRRGALAVPPEPDPASQAPASQAPASQALTASQTLAAHWCRAAGEIWVLAPEGSLR